MSHAPQAFTCPNQLVDRMTDTTSATPPRLRVNHGRRFIEAHRMGLSQQMDSREDAKTQRGGVRGGLIAYPERHPNIIREKQAAAPP